MALPYYVNSIDNKMREQPNDYFRGLQQAFYDSQWEDTTARTDVLMEFVPGTRIYKPIEVWINKVVGNTTTFMKNGEDFRQLLFKDIDQQCGRGYMFLFEDSYWLADFWNPSQGLSADILVRRCNNSLNIVDPENGSIFAIPCVVDYDMTSPTPLISSYILTPNSHAIVHVQANDDTIRLFKLNKRFMLNGRPFKLYAYQDTLNKSLNQPQPPTLTLDLYLDELHAGDDIENNVADNGEYNFSITIQSLPNLVFGSSGQFIAQVNLNGEEINKEIIWESSNNDVVKVDVLGNYDVVGNIDETSIITAKLSGNNDVQATLEVKIVNGSSVSSAIILEPEFSKIRDNETIISKVYVLYNGEKIAPDTIKVNINGQASKFLSAQIVNNQLELTCLNFDTQLHDFTIIVSNNNPSFEMAQTFSVQCVSMFG